MPTRFCLKNTGPGESSLMATARMRTVSYTHLDVYKRQVKKQFILKGNEIYQMLINKLTEEEK